MFGVLFEPSQYYEGAKPRGGGEVRVSPPERGEKTKNICRKYINYTKALTFAFFLYNWRMDTIRWHSIVFDYLAHYHSLIGVFYSYIFHDLVYENLY